MLTFFATLVIVTYLTSAATWNYDDNAEDWIDAYPECGYSRQSPIDVTFSEDSTICDEPLTLDWHANADQHFVIRNNGHSLVATPFDMQYKGSGDISGLEIMHHANDTDIRLHNGFYNTFSSAIHSEYCFNSLHFHWAETDDFGSEHALNGEYYPLEVHLVHYSCDYEMITDALTDYITGDVAQKYDDDNVLAVIGVMFEIGEANAALDAILKSVIIDGVQEYYDETIDNLIELFYTDFDLNQLVPENKEYIGYEGSLTTPPCLETVRWHVMKDILTVSETQLDAFRSLLSSTNANDTMAPNYRPIQPLNDRNIYQCQEAVNAEAVDKEIEEVEVDDKEDDDDDEVDAIWFYLAVIFICLFGIAVLVIICVCAYKGFKRDENKKDNRHTVKYETVVDEQREMV